MVFTPGARLGPYEILSPLGAGGMGEVYRARDTRLEREVAIKVLPAAWSADPVRLRRFAREARAAASLNHPHICTIYDVGTGESGDAPFIAMELLVGETVQQRLTRGPLEISRLIADGIALAEALEAAHGKGMLHRDIKPANLFLTTRGPKILDFGLAKTAAFSDDDLRVTQSAETGLTAPGSPIGTAAYMSPEQLRGEPLDVRTDVFSLGLVLYEAATGRPAFTGPTPSVVSAAILHTEPIAPRQLRSELPLTLEQIILKAIEKDRELRYQTASALRSDLKRLQREMTSQPVLTPGAGALSHSSLRKVPWRWIAAAIVLLGGFAIWTLRSERTVPSPSQADAGGPHRLVVLPFENISGQTTDQWLAGAFADSVTLGLRDAENLVLVHRERVLELGGAEKGLDSSAVERIVKALTVRYYVTGSYQRVGQDIRVVARLVDANAGTIAVQQSLTDGFANLLHLQDDLAQRFATALHESPAAGLTPRTSSLSAYRSVAEANDLYLAGRYRDAVARLQDAIKQDAGYADAWALLSKSNARLAGASDIESSSARSEFQRQALGASLRAAEIAPRLYEAQVALALGYRGVGESELSRQATQRAIDINPRLAEAYEILANSYGAAPNCQRRIDEERAESLYRRALELDPRLVTAHVLRATNLFWGKPGAQAGLDYLDSVRDLVPAGRLLRPRAVALLFLKRPDEAEQHLRELATLGPSSIQDEWVMAGVELLRRNDDVARRRMEAVIEKDFGTLRELDTVRLYGVIGDPGMAARHLERAFRYDPSCVAYVTQSPAFAPFRNHPAIQGVLSKDRLP